MAFDRRLLGEHEELVLDLRPHWSQLAGRVRDLLLVVAAGAAAVALDAPRLLQYLVVGLLVVALVRLVFAWIGWRGINFVLTSERLIYRTGVASRRGLEIPLDRVGTIRFDQSFFERLLQRGDLAIEALGDGGVQVFHNVPRPKHVQREIYAAIEADQHALFVEQAQAGAQQAASMAPQSSSPYSIPQQIDQLDQLRRRGVLTDYEFEVKKRELLDRM